MFLIVAKTQRWSEALDETDFERAQLKTARALSIVFWMGPLRRGVTVRQVRDAIQGDWSLRTIRRDLVLLESIGLVERYGVHWRALRSSRLEDFLKGKVDDDERTNDSDDDGNG